MPSAAALGRKGLLLPGRSGARCPCGCEGTMPCFCADGVTPIPTCCCQANCAPDVDCQTPCGGQPNPCRCFDGTLLPQDCCNPNSEIYNQQGPGQPCDCGLCCRNNLCACGPNAQLIGTSNTLYESYDCCGSGAGLRRRYTNCPANGTGAVFTGSCVSPTLSGPAQICTGMSFPFPCDQNPQSQNETLPFRINAQRVGGGFSVSAGTIGFQCTTTLPACAGGPFSCTRVGTTTCQGGAPITSQFTQTSGSLIVIGCVPCRSNDSQLAFNAMVRARNERIVARVSGLRDATTEEAIAAIASGGCSGCGGGAGLTRRLA